MVLMGVLSACSVPTPATPVPTQVPVQQKTEAPTIAPSPAASQIPSPTMTVMATSQAQAGEPFSLDPCVLLDSAAAQNLTGISLGNGVESTLDSGVNVCTYGANTANVLMVEVGQTKDVDAAKALQASFLNDIKEGLAQFGDIPTHVTEISDFGDGAVSATLDETAINVTGGAFAFRKNTIFFGFSDLVLGGKAPTPEAMRAEAALVLDKLP